METSHSTSKNILYSLMSLGIGVVVGSIVTLYLFINITGGIAAPSEPISAPTLKLDAVVLTVQATAEPVEAAAVAPPKTSTTALSNPTDCGIKTAGKGSGRFSV